LDQQWAEVEIAPLESDLKDILGVSNAGIVADEETPPD